MTSVHLLRNWAGSGKIFGLSIGSFGHLQIDTSARETDFANGFALANGKQA
jgi:hypothetical protein